MTHSADHHGGGSEWESIGRAAEDFARRVARDAGRFAERMEEHAGDFAHDIARDWRRAQRRYRHRYLRAASAPDVRRIFEDIRTVVSDVLEGVDELIERVFTEPSATTDAEWLRLVVNSDAACSGCTQTILAGDAAYVRRSTDGREFRCLTCGVPAPASAS